MIKILSLIALALLSIAFTFTFAFKVKDRQKPSSKPNIVIILTDQQTNDCISALGNPNLKTPALDWIAKNGTYFTESYCTSPVCGPSRSSLITGRMPHETGVVWNTNTLSGRFPTIGQIFAKAGYNTAWAGKWHLPESYPQKKNLDSVAGFKLLPFTPLNNEWDLGINTDGPIAQSAVNYLRNYKESKPFLLSIQLHNPHDICHVPRKPANYASASQIKDPLPELPANFQPGMKEPQWYEEKRQMDHYGDELLKTKNYTRQDWRAYLYHYYRFAETVDGEIAKILQALKERDLVDNTIIVFSSDHGDGGGAHQWAAKLSFYDEVSTVPFMISWKGHIPAGVVNRDQLVSGIDLAPTLCDYAGIANAPAFTGVSLRRVLDNPRASTREYLVVQLEDDLLNQSRHARMIRNKRFKYALFNHGSDNEQLFDLWNDPGETQNLAYSKNYQGVKEQLRVNLKDWISHTQDVFIFPDSKTLTLGPR